MYSKLAPQSSRFDLWALSQGRASSSSGRSFAGLTGCWSRRTWKRCQPSRWNSHPIRSLWNFEVSPKRPYRSWCFVHSCQREFFQETRYQPHNILWALLLCTGTPTDGGNSVVEFLRSHAFLGLFLSVNAEGPPRSCENFRKVWRNLCPWHYQPPKYGWFPCIFVSIFVLVYMSNVHESNDLPFLFGTRPCLVLGHSSMPILDSQASKKRLFFCNFQVQSWGFSFPKLQSAVFLWFSDSINWSEWLHI